MYIYNSICYIYLITFLFIIYFHCQIMTAIYLTFIIAYLFIQLFHDVLYFFIYFILYFIFIQNILPPNTSRVRLL